MSEIPFDTAAEQFIGFYDTVRGRVRQEIPRRNLLEFLPAENIEVLDFGGGDGRDAFWLAEQGHTVTLLDKSESMLTKAQTTKDSAPAEIADRITIRSGGIEVLQTKINHYDLVLSHGVLMYELADPHNQLRALSRALKPGGYLSLLTDGAPGAIQRAIREGDLTKAEHIYMTGRSENHLNLKVQTYNPSELQAMLAHAELQVINWFGVRLLTDSDERPVDTVDPQDLQSLMNLEHSLGRQPDCRGMGLMLQFIARKSHPSSATPQ